MSVLSIFRAESFVWLVHFPQGFCVRTKKRVYAYVVESWNIIGYLPYCAPLVLYEKGALFKCRNNQLAKKCSHFNYSIIWPLLLHIICCLVIEIALFSIQYSHGYTSVLDMNTAQDGANIWDKIHHEGKCVKLLWSSSGAKTTHLADWHTGKYQIHSLGTKQVRSNSWKES